ncbi:VapE domain-containing protein [Spirosoma utsteinense]|uniref:VapE domain-containing protein n=1 Tax=Spirosoma utsteinense TaxID=2585773 RepID=UPI001ED4635C|nr:VapE domain-containing protein [Spirosoma utsteinense]MBC3785740.1 hypothetical protein [Spirosoma utsteinense]
MTKITIEAQLISLYETSWMTDALAEITTREFFDGIAIGRWAKHVAHVRAAQCLPLPEGKTSEEHAKVIKKEYYKRKTAGNAVTLAGTFNTRKSDAIREYSGLIAADLDHLGADLMRVFNLLKADPYVLAVFRSIGGSGLCVVFRIDTGKWLESFEGIKRYLIETYGVVTEFDDSVKDVSRLRYVSHDPDIAVNFKAQLFKKYVAREKKAPKPQAFVHTDVDIRFILEQIHARALDLTGSYEEWYRIGWALISQYGEEARGLFREVSGYNSDYDAEETDKKFKYLLQTRPTQISIGTFYYHCKLAGLDIMTPQTREIVSVAAMSKKQRISKASALDTVVSMTDADRATAEPIIEQVYANTVSVDTQETLFDQLELFLKTNYPLRRNEVTRYIEDENGTGLTEVDFNSIWVHASKSLGEKVSDKMVNKLIHSHFVKSFNPLKDFFVEHQDRRPVGVIKALADTLETTSGFEENAFMPNYAEFIIRKWMLGIISAIFDEHCPLVLVLTGRPNTGKTEWFRRLLPRELHEKFFAETIWPVSKDTDIMMAESLISFNDEWKGDTVKNPETLKGFASAERFTLREPYGASNVKRRRLAVMCGTSNPVNIVKDPDNNRKIFGINVLSINFNAYNVIDKTDLLMEAYWAYLAGERHHLTNAEVAYIASEVKGFENHTLERELIEKYYAKPASITDAQLCSQVDALVYLQNMSGIKNLDKNVITREFKALGFEYQGKPVYYAPDGKVKRGFWTYKSPLVS